MDGVNPKYLLTSKKASKVGAFIASALAFTGTIGNLVTICALLQVESSYAAMQCEHIHYDGAGVSGNSRSRPFPRMKASDSLSRIMGMDFFIPFPFPNFGNGFFSFPSRSRILGMGFFHSLPIPEIWEWIFLFPSRSRISGMGFFNSLPVPEFREWAFSIPFPFPNPQKSFPLTPGLIPSYDETNGICCQAVGCDMSDEISNNFHNTKSKSKSAKQLLSRRFYQKESHQTSLCFKQENSQVVGVSTSLRK